MSSRSLRRESSIDLKRSFCLTWLLYTPWTIRIGPAVILRRLYPGDIDSTIVKNFIVVEGVSQEWPGFGSLRKGSLWKSVIRSVRPVGEWRRPGNLWCFWNGGRYIAAGRERVTILASIPFVRSTTHYAILRSYQTIEVVFTASHGSSHRHLVCEGRERLGRLDLGALHRSRPASVWVDVGSAGLNSSQLCCVAEQRIR